MHPGRSTCTVRRFSRRPPRPRRWRGPGNRIGRC